MESRRETLTLVKICRFCLTQNRPLGSLYEKSKPKSIVTLPLKILTSVSIEVFPSDKKPTYICDRCKFFMNLFYEYKHIVRQADESILQYVQNGTALGTVNWPPSLTKVYRHMTDSEPVKTVVEGGATIQVTSHDIMSDSDEEDGNIYNVKIGDEEDSKACVKVVTGKDIKTKDNAKGKDTPIKEESKDEKRIAEGCYACNECDCTYPLEQLLNLHKIQKHRTRSIPCNQCDAKFFTKYDLAIHQVRHSGEMPFECVACGKKFKRLILLKRHEKVIHPEMPQQICPHCPATFLSLEKLEEHKKKHLRLHKHPCLQCDKKFQDRSALQRHVDIVHNKEATLRCEYCPERFGSITKLARHVRTHVTERPYPCKYCDKSFTKSHHYTRHIRVKHFNQNRNNISASEQYRCDQCEDVFDSQDDLIYHSAIHATQNLTCPLCQEKFEDVEAVTAHIKSHVNGVEFMCDFCELIFTTQEKLDTHLTTVHEDEMQQDMNDESSMEIDGEDDEDDNGINVKQVGDDMIIEIKKPDNYLINDAKDDMEEKIDNTNSEESESEVTYTELQTVDTLAIMAKDAKTKLATPIKMAEKPAATTPTTDSIKIVSKTNDIQTSNILRRAEEVKRKAIESPDTSETAVIRKMKPAAKAEVNNSGGASDKSLRLLEKELQDLKRTNSRNTETIKPSSNKVLETVKSKRPQFQTSTPKLSKQLLNKALVVEKKPPEKRTVTKENKEPRETKEVKNNNISSKEEKDNKEKDTKEKDKESNEKDIKEKDIKEKEKNIEKDKGKETPKSVVKNGAASDRNSTEDGVRRSTRPSKIKDYAKMIRDRTQENSDDDETTEDDEDYREPDRSNESRRGRRPAQQPKVIPAAKTPPAASPANPPRKRGRPRKNTKEVPAKMKKEGTEESVQESNLTTKEDKVDTENTSSMIENDQSLNKTPEPTATPPTDVLVSPTGQTLKKVLVKALPPGIKAMPLPANSRPMPAGELCQMQIGKKVVKVQKIVMTKAEVEAMAKKGLVEMKDGTMVLKQGIKLPTASDVSTVKSTLIGDADAGKDTPKKEKAIPTRCDLGEES